jgi:diadenosine tetraphosphate (Ap4A) HIT family hydrolase
MSLLPEPQGTGIGDTAVVAACPFCDRISVGPSVVYAEPFAVAFPDGFPVADGHLLVVPRAMLPELSSSRPRSGWASLGSCARCAASLPVTATSPG